MILKYLTMGAIASFPSVAGSVVAVEAIHSEIPNRLGKLSWAENLMGHNW